MRSLWAKISNFSNDLHEREADICFLCEVWEKKGKRVHKAVAINTNKFDVTKLNIHISKPLEVVWAMLRPMEVTGLVKRVILCSIYSPPNSKKNPQLVDHISITYNKLKTRYPDAAFILSEDKNQLNENLIL